MIRIRMSVFWRFSTDISVGLPAFVLLLLGACPSPSLAQYSIPPPEIADFLQGSTTPIVTFNPQRDRMLIYEAQRYPGVGNLANQVLKLAGLRINPDNRGPNRVTRCVQLTLKLLNSDREIVMRLPAKTDAISLPIWSPDGQQYAFMRLTARDIGLYLNDGMRGRVRRSKDVHINGALGTPIRWLPDGKTLLCQLVPDQEGDVPGKTRAPRGPLIEVTGGEGAGRAPQDDLLVTDQDVRLLDFYGRSQLALVDSGTGEVTKIGRPEIFSRVQPSPDGQFILVSYLRQPYPTDLKVSDFPRRIEVWTREGERIYHLDDLPARRNIPAGGVLNGPRLYNWRPTGSAELVWVQPLDHGNPAIPFSHRDQVMSLSAPFTEKAREILRAEQRLESIVWGEDPHIALVRELDLERRLYRTSLFNPDSDEEGITLLWTHDPNDRYGDPGKPLTRSLPNGQSVMRIHHNSIYLSGYAPSPTGDLPYLDLFNLTTHEVDPVFESAGNEYETVVALIEPDATAMITRRESATEPPNYFIRFHPEDERVALTQFEDRFAELGRVHRQLINFERYDGAKMSFVLYLPPDYEVLDAELPTVLWVHPRTHVDTDQIQRMRGSLRRFPTYKGAAQRFLAMQGYAVLDSTTIPVVGDPNTANDSFIEQIVAGAKAAIDKAVELGFADPNRIGVGGHSYGAFLAANLLAHSDMFRAGVARSGAYNRTLTPFGFQNERRSLWQAPDLYTRLSPLMFANRIEEPLLLIHGAVDENPATDPIQSKWMYQAVRGNGGTARLVSLPYEGHRYEAVESVGHVAWEMVRWFDRHLKAPISSPLVMPKPTLDMPEVFVP